MQVFHNKGSRSLIVRDLPNNHPHGLSELKISVNYVGHGGCREGIAIDNDIIPAIVDGLNRDNPSKEARAAVNARKAAAAKWAEVFNADALQPNGRNKALRSKPKKALGVIVLTETVRNYLAEFDPMALMQVQQALNGKDYTNYLTP